MNDSQNVCDCCKLVPLSYLSLDLPEPLAASVDPELDNCYQDHAERRAKELAPVDRHDLNWLGNSLQADFPRLRKLVPRRGIPQGTSANYDLARVREGADACSFMDPLALVAGAGAESLGGVETDSNLWGESVLAPVIS